MDIDQLIALLHGLRDIHGNVDKWIEVNGVTKTMAQWAKDTGIHMTTLHRRYHAGVRGEEFLKPSKPVLPNNKRWATRQNSHGVSA